jgi:hypothetical protein
MIRFIFGIVVGILLTIFYNIFMKGGDIMPIVDCYVTLIIAGRRTLNQVRNMYIRKLVKEELIAMGLEELTKEEENK